MTEVAERPAAAGEDKVLGVVRASSWSDLFDCSLRWYFKNIEGLRFPARGPTQVGRAIHSGTAVFDNAHLGMPEKLNNGFIINEAVDVAADAIDKPTDDNGSPIEIQYDADMAQGTAKDFAVQLTAKYCTKVGPFKHYSAVELKCVGLDVKTEHGTISLTGTTDRIELRGTEEGITDFKSGANAVGADGIASVAGHHLQLGVYTLMAEHELKRELAAARILGFQTNSKLRIGEGVVEHPKVALVGDGDNPGLIEIAAGMLKSGVFPANPKSMLCSKRWCPGWHRCVYHA